MKPKSVLEHGLKATELDLVNQARGFESKPRRYFRASELGTMCLRSLYYDMKGEQPRPRKLEHHFELKRGGAWEHIIVPWLSQYYVVDFVEGWSDDTTRNLSATSLLTNSIDAGRLVRWNTQSNSTVFPTQTNCHIWVEHQGHELEIHFRPDLILCGLRDPLTHEITEEWDPEDWIIVDLKAGKKFGIQMDRKQEPSSAFPKVYGWSLPYVAQLQCYMHAFGLVDSAILKGEMDTFEMNCDQFQPQRRGRYPLPEYQWQRIPYDEKFFRQCLDRCVKVLEALDKEEPPAMKCHAKDTKWLYDRCLYNAEAIGGVCSGPQCPGKGLGL